MLLEVCISSDVDITCFELSVAIDACRRACEDFPGIERAWIFGSFARGEQTAESDIDIRLELAAAGGFSLFDLVHFGEAVEHFSGRSCDIVTSRNIKNQRLAYNIERDKVLAYERT